MYVGDENVGVDVGVVFVVVLTGIPSEEMVIVVVPKSGTSPFELVCVNGGTLVGPVNIDENHKQVQEVVASGLEPVINSCQQA